ncbi:MAG: hypothetical protein ATN32_03140 [Candidatus Epulonipiscium fishelsonii]|nr:MAG: hypothetical protein ATN32_03140 [Epulopiscium sp. AS2M-Bin002]
MEIFFLIIIIIILIDYSLKYNEKLKQENEYYKLKISEMLYNDTKQKLNKEIEEIYSFIETNKVGMIVTLNKEKNINYVSPLLKQILGYKEICASHDLNDYICEDDMVIKNQNLKLILEEQCKSFVMDIRILKNSGEYHWFECRFNKIDDQKDTDFLISFVDINERQIAKEKLIYSNELNESLLDSLEAKVAGFDDKYNVVVANHAMQKICENSSNYKIKISDIYMNDLIIKDKIDLILSNKVEKISFEHCVKKHNKEIWYKVDLTNNNEYGGIISYRDISKTKKLNDSLISSDLRYQKLIERLPCAVFLQDINGITYCNKEALKLLKMSDVSLVLGTPLIDFVHIDSKRSHVEKFLGTYTNTISAVEQVLVNVQGGLVDVEIDRTKAVVDGKMMDIYIVRDISEKLRAQEYKQSLIEKDRQLMETREYDRIRSEFFANISHELRTPINIISSAVQLIDSLDLDKVTDINNITKFNGIIRQNCSRLLRLVNNLIDITKIEAGFYNLKMELYNIVNVVEEITLSLVNYIESKGLSITFDTYIEECYAYCDIDSLERIMLNLLANAVKFTQHGGEIVVTIYKEDKEIVISVKDNGIGIPAEKRQVIFERFRQVDKTLDRKYEGSGIGLSLVKLLVELQNGTITVNSELNKGSDFQIMFPIMDSDLNEENVYNLNLKPDRVNMEFSDIYFEK